MATRTRRPRGLSAHHVNEEARLHTIMTDKSTLFAVRLLGKENWVKIDERPNCFYCSRKFRAFVLKRHCRSCGEVVCASCYRRRRVAVTPSLEVTVRLCFDCIDKAMLYAENEHFCTSTAVLEPSDSEIDKMEAIVEEKSPHHDDPMKHVRESFQTTSTSTSSRSRFSDTDRWSASESNRSSRSESGGPMPGSLLNSRRELPMMMQATETIEFLPEAQQAKIYETRRHAILTRLHVLDTASEMEYDALCELLRQALDCGVAAIAFMDQTRQWFKSRYGIAQTELPRDIAFCSQLLQTPLPTIIRDVSKDARFNTNPLVTGSANIRFYATSPICDPSTGIVIGSVFVMDPTPKQKLPPRAMEILSYVSSAAEKLLQGETLPAFPLLTKPKRHFSTTHPMRRESYPDCRSRSLQSVPEEIEDADFRVTLPHSNPSSLSSHRSKQRSQRSKVRSAGSASVPALSSQPRIQLLDPNVLLTFTKATTTSTSKLSIEDLISSEPKATPLSKNLDSSCLKLLQRVTSTQQLLARQHDSLLATLTEHSTRISLIEQTVERIEHNMSKGPHYGPFRDEAAGRRSVEMKTMCSIM
ncbi:hypothetical protein PsorP6_013542 [Peronosclerospora sorghi]|uniref:Uncharacterized protein n=1 Tax=Peronosclerospora sorghi TaxID=230839 RepID=A0ACC0VHP6_9STRA|nr:hypothetical protein PsorP6_013542 [Peronosclerospora sorghi]